MSTYLGPAVYGARSARELLLKIKRANATAGAIDVERGADLLEAALADAGARRGLLLALAEFLSVALEGSAIKPEAWAPLEAFDTRSHRIAPPVRRF